MKQMGDTELSNTVVSQLMKLVSNELVNMLTTWKTSAQLVQNQLLQSLKQIVQATAKAAGQRHPLTVKSIQKV